MDTVVPCDFLLVILILPLWRLIICLHTVRPRPMPFAFVVKNGSNSLLKSTFEMPGPLSLKYI